MAGVRRVARLILRYLVPLFFLAVLVQVFFAGYGIFGAGDETIENADELDLHRGFGFIISHMANLLLLITALLAWLPDKRLRAMAIAAPILLLVQPFLTEGRWAGAFHPVNAFLILGLLGYLTDRLWRGADVGDTREGAARI